MGFMQPQIRHGDWYRVETTAGTYMVPYDVVGETDSADDLADYVEGKPIEVDFVTDSYGARLSAPGYMDCTEWCVFDTREEAEAYLRETYDLEDDEECDA